MQKEKTSYFSFSKNLILFWVGLGTIGLGYIFLAIVPKDSFFSLTLAPIVLVIGYTIVIPIALFLPPGNPSGNKKDIKGD